MLLEKARDIFICMNFAKKTTFKDRHLDHKTFVYIFIFAIIVDFFSIK